MSIKGRITKLEKNLFPNVKGKAFLNIWDDLSENEWRELNLWALGETDQRPDFWPSDEQAIEIRQQGYFLQTKDELRETFERNIEANKKAMEADQ